MAEFTVPDFGNIDEFKAWVAKLDERAIQSWTAENWVEMYHKIEGFRGYFGNGSEMVKHCPEEFIKLYGNYRMEPEQLRYITRLAHQAGEQLAQEELDASKLAIRTRKYYPVSVPEFKSTADFKAWVGNLDERAIQQWNMDDWIAVYKQVEPIRRWPDMEQIKKIDDKVLAQFREELKAAQALGPVDADTYIYRCCFDYSCQDEFEKLYRNSTLDPKKMNFVRQYMHQFDDMGDGLLRRYETGRTSSITEMTEKIEDITATGTKYTPEQRVHSTVYVGEVKDRWYGRASASTEGRAVLEMNSRSLIDGAIGTAAHESAHIHLQTGNAVQAELLRKGILAHPELGKDFAALMMYNGEFYMSADVIDELYGKDRMTAEEYRVLRQKFRGYSHEPIEKFSQIYGKETERAYRRTTGQLSERAALKINGIIKKTPAAVQYTDRGIELTYKAGYYENFSGKKLLRDIKGNFRSSVAEELSVRLDKTGKEVRVTIPKGYETKLVEKNPLSFPKRCMQKVKEVDHQINRTINGAIQKGSEKLNNSPVGKAYNKAKKAVANSTPVQKTKEVAKKAKTAVVQTAKKVGQKVAQSKVGTAVKQAANGTAAKTAKTAVNKAAKSAVTQAAKKTVTKAVTNTAVKAVGKSVLKKIPLISIGAGLIFGAQRAMAGDFAGAAGEVASGVCGTFPGVGTAASVAIDAGLAGRDIYKEVKKADDATKQQVKKDRENARKYGEKKQKQVARASAKAKSPTTQKQATAAKMKTNAANANKYQKQMEAIINKLNKANGKAKAMDAAKTAAALYQKYGDNAYALLQEAVQSPGSYQKLGDGKLKTSRDVIQHLCQMPNTKQNQQIVQSIVQNRARSK